MYKAIALAALLGLAGAAPAAGEPDWKGDPADEAKYQADWYQCQQEARQAFKGSWEVHWGSPIWQLGRKTLEDKMEDFAKQCLRARGYIVTKRSNVYPAGWQGKMR